MKATLAKLIKEAIFSTPLRRNFFPYYQYNFDPRQLCFLCQCMDETRDVDGSIAEIGCGNGATTVFLNKYMDAQQIEKDYFIVDTFSGFVAQDIDFEVNKRGKTRDLFSGFRANKRRWVDGTMLENNIARVRSIEADVNAFDLKSLAPLSFVLLDVDLYRPMLKGLRELYDALSVGGIMVVDDCDPSNVQWDGSDQAYKEFMQQLGELPAVVHGKLGIVRKLR